MKKYEFTGETKEIRLLFRTATLHRIRATVAFGSSSSARTAARSPCATARSASAPPARPEPGLKAGDSSTKNFFQKNA